MILRAAVVFSFVCALAAAPSVLQAQSNKVIPDDPVAFIGHGMLIARDGRTIRPDVDFIEKTQELYIKSLRDRLPEADRKIFDDQRAALFRDNAIDRRNRLTGELANDRMAAETCRRHAGRVDQRQEFVDGAARRV
jgi:hypothetical protein